MKKSINFHNKFYQSTSFLNQSLSFYRICYIVKSVILLFYFYIEDSCFRRNDTHFYYSLFTNKLFTCEAFFTIHSLNISPLSSKFLNIFNDGAHGESTQTFHFFVFSLAILVACSILSTSKIFLFLNKCFCFLGTFT